MNRANLDLGQIVRLLSQFFGICKRERRKDFKFDLGGPTELDNKVLDLIVTFELRKGTFVNWF